MCVLHKHAQLRESIKFIWEGVNGGCEIRVLLRAEEGNINQEMGVAWPSGGDVLSVTNTVICMGGG